MQVLPLGDGVGRCGERSSVLVDKSRRAAF
jgi:hypothetical protein